MSKIQLTLEKVTGTDENGNDILEKKIYIVDHVKGRMVRRGLEVSENIDFNNMKKEDVDSMITYIVEVFKNKFTIDDFYDGIDSDKLIDTVMDVIDQVNGTTARKAAQIKNEIAE